MMPAGRNGNREVDANPTAITRDPTEQLVKVLEKLTVSSVRSVFKAPTFNSDGEVELFIKRFQEVAIENG